MIKRTMLVVLGAFFAVLAIGDPAKRCGGSEGPKPFNDITASFKSEATLVSTNGQVEEFFVWNRRRLAIFRNDANEVDAIHTKTKQQFHITTSSKAIAKVRDGQERFFAVEQEPWVFDTEKGRWYRFGGVPENVDHVFFDHGPLGKPRLYSLATVFETSGEQEFKLFRYRIGDTNAKRICPGLKFSAGKGYHVGNGHSYPDIVLYRSIDLGGAYELTLYTLNARSCAVTNLGTYIFLIPGKVQAVHYFAPLKSVMVKVDHPTRNLLWDQDKSGCRFYDIGQDRQALVLGYDQPVIATFREKDGLNLVYLNNWPDAKAKVASILKDMPMQEIRGSDIYLTEGGTKLYVAPKFADKTRFLLDVTIPELSKLE